MAQTGYTPIQLYKSATAAAAPVAGNLQDGELAINTNDGKLFYKDSSGVVQTMASKAAAAGTFSSVTITGGTITGITDLAVADGGTGASSQTAYAVLCGGTTSTAAYQSIASVGTAGQVLTSNGAGALPTFQAAGGGFASGTKLLFAQTAAPTGWTKDTTNYNNHALRVVTGTAGSGGTVDFTTAFASQAVSGAVGNTTLSTAQLPSHAHPVVFGNGGGCQGPAPLVTLYGSVFNANTSATGGGGSHTHSFSGTAINLAVKYLDVITATKD